MSTTAKSKKQNIPPPLSPLQITFHELYRLSVLFLFGVLFGSIVDTLQRSHGITRWPTSPSSFRASTDSHDQPHQFRSRQSNGGEDLFSNFPIVFLNHQTLSLLLESSWVPLSCGLAGCLVGTLYPLLDAFFHTTMRKRDWNHVFRCCCGFIGVNYAISKVPWSNGTHLTLSLAVFSLGLWYTFDRTWYGFLLSGIVAICGTLAVSTLVNNGVYSFTKADFLGLRSWVPCILHSSCICFGVIGRKLS